MLSLLTRKLCPIMTLAIATVGCGKKIGESDSSPASSTQNQERPSAYVLQIDSSVESKKTYQLPQNAQFHIPTELKVREGASSTTTVEIRYQSNPYDSYDYQFKCSYTGTAATDLKLTSCVDYDDDNLGNISNHLFALYKNDHIELKFVGTRSEKTVVDVIHSMIWK